jgi:hypothetical protein
MPFAQFTANGEIEALYLQDGAERVTLPLSDIRVLRFLQASDPELTNALLNASDDAHRMLLSSLISLLVRNQKRLPNPPPEPNKLEPHQSLDALINIVETDDNEALHSLEQSDRNTVRIIEDVIDILIDRGVITLKDLPQGAQHLLEVRRALRAYLSETEVSEDWDDGGTSGAATREVRA